MCACKENEDVHKENQHPDRKDVIKGVHHFEEVNSDAIDIVLNNSEFLQHDYITDDVPLRNLDRNNRKLVQDAGTRLQCESKKLRENLKLRIKLYDREGLTADRVRYIDVVSGAGDNIIECYRRENGTISWGHRKREDILKDEHSCGEVNSDTIDIVLNNSEFLQHDYITDDDPLRNVDRSNRKLVQDAATRLQRESIKLRENLKLRFKLYDRECLTTDRVKYIDVVSGAGDNIIECYRREDGNISWGYRKVVNSEGQLPDIPVEEHTFDEINAMRILQILNTSKFLEDEGERRLLLEVSRRVAREPEWKMNNCELTIVLHNLSGHVHHCVKQIVIKAGRGEHKIQCSNIQSVDIHWECQERLDPRQDVPKERHKCEILTSSEINKILNKSKFLETSSHRNFVASDVRMAVDKESEVILKNCTLIIDLENLEGATNTPMKQIIIKAGNGESEIHSSIPNPWQVVKISEKISYRDRAGMMLSKAGNQAKSAFVKLYEDNEKMALTGITFVGNTALDQFKK